MWTRRGSRRWQDEGRGPRAEEVGFGYESIDRRQVEQIVDPSQTGAIGDALVYALRSKLLTRGEWT